MMNAWSRNEPARLDLTVLLAAVGRPLERRPGDRSDEQGREKAEGGFSSTPAAVAAAVASAVKVADPPIADEKASSFAVRRPSRS